MLKQHEIPDLDSLLRACRRQDSQAQKVVYHHYIKAMYNVSLRLLNHSAEAEDVVQEAFLEAFQKIGQFRAEASFGAWLKRIVINKSINQLRKRRLNLVEISASAQDTLEEDSSSNEAEIAWQVARVRQGIRALPDGFRVVLSMYLLEGYDHREIAEFLGISESTSKSQYSRAKKKLLKIIQELP